MTAVILASLNQSHNPILPNGTEITSFLLRCKETSWETPWAVMFFGTLLWPKEFFIWPVWECGEQLYDKQSNILLLTGSYFCVSATTKHGLFWLLFVSATDSSVVCSIYLGWWQPQHVKTSLYSHVLATRTKITPKNTHNSQGLDSLSLAQSFT